ncbi:hypothetical protein FDB42_09035 [Clostridium botulinum]|uniref:hypothetical protein n=1 Tax=Clostridium botulinum TaxID=1491 RepID=UPI0013FE93A6|nr:hypothetical protein [Clostridium botulinum]MBY6917458.1 hypothetical protein [Clostridium botulinum]NFO40260.1 hypothetical protein [Clostridium botulinum]NFQ40214.1 hypothetical protein [Clostridium botulinum]
MGKILIVGKLRKKISVNGELVEVNNSVNDLNTDFLIELFADSKRDIKYESNKELKIHKKDFKDEIVRYAKRTLIFKSREFEMMLSRKTYDASILIECSIEYGSEIISSKTVNNNKLFDSVYEFKIKIKEWLSKFCKTIYWIYDENNIEICTEAYQKIHNTENRFRQVLSLFMMRQCGDIYLNKYLTEEFNRYSDFYSKGKYIDFKNINSKLYNIGFSKLPELLKMKFTQVVAEEEKSINDIVNETLGVLSDLEDVTYSYKMIEKAKKKLSSKLSEIGRSESIFTNEILQILDGEFDKKWDELSGMRNMVMHNKPICKKLFDDIDSMCNFMQVKFNKCLDNIETCFYTEEELIYDALCDEEYEKQQYQFDYIERLREECGIEFQLDEDYVMNELVENKKEIDELMTTLNNINDLTSKVEDIYGNCESIRDYLKSLEKKTLVEHITNVLEKLELEIDNVDMDNESEELIDEFIMLITNHINLENLYDYLVDNEIDDEFCICKKIAEFGDCEGDIYELWVQGDLNPEDYGFDYIDCILNKNNNLLKSASIEIFYGSYENQGEGYINCEDVNAVNSDLIDIYDDIEEKTKDMVTKIEKVMKLLGVDKII